MPFDIFWSYKRDESVDERLTDQIVDLLRNKVGYAVYRDVNNAVAGMSWAVQLQKVIESEDLKCVVVLCTRAAAKTPRGIQQEVAWAREAGKQIVAVAVDHEAVKVLLGQRSDQYIDLVGKVPSTGELTPQQLDWLNDKFRQALTWRVCRFLEEQRENALKWANNQRHQPPFWGQSLATDAASFVWIARGGSGKSTLLAAEIIQLCRHPSIYPVLVGERFLESLTSTSRQNPGESLYSKLGARTVEELPAQVEALADETSPRPDWAHMKIVFVLDGLEQIVLPGNQRQLTEAVSLLHRSAPTWITCRTEIWRDIYRPRLSISEKLVQEVPELDPNQVQKILTQYTKLHSNVVAQWANNRLLGIPLFLDAVLKMGTGGQSVPNTETEFLGMMWQAAVIGQNRTTVLPGTVDRQWWMNALAKLQLNHFAYEIPLDELRNEPGYVPQFESGLQSLRRDGDLVQRSSQHRGNVVRLRHDLLDCFSMARLLLDSSRYPREEADVKAALANLCKHCEAGIGWSILAMVVQAAYESGQHDLVTFLYQEFLLILDRKNFNNGKGPENARAWSVTNVLKARLPVMLPYILKSLAGDRVDSLQETNPADVQRRASRLDQVTQEAASTLLSAFAVYRPDNSTVDRQVEASMTQFVKSSWKLKGRALDALGRLGTERSLEAIVEFGKAQLNPPIGVKADVGALYYVALNLRYFSRNDRAENLLTEISMSQDVSSKDRRVAAESLKLMNPMSTIPIPAREEDELIDGLRLRARDNPESYSDWMQMQEYAEYIRNKASVHLHNHGQVQFTDKVRDALVNALDHDQKLPRMAVAQALEYFNDPVARDALVCEVLEKAVPQEVRDACLTSLRNQYRRMSDARVRQEFRFVLLAGAKAAQQDGLFPAWEGLHSLALDPELRHADDWYADTWALELVPFRSQGWRSACSLVANEDVPVDPFLLQAVAQMNVDDAGPEFEQKYRIVDLTANEDLLEIQLGPSSWAEGKTFHTAAQRDVGSLLKNGRRWLVPAPLGKTRFPGLAVAHAIVLTTDRQILLAQRSDKVTYSPLHWSASFEEQLTTKDLVNLDQVFQEAASRGFLEEFGIALDPHNIRLVSAILELDNLNLAMVVVIESNRTLDEIRRRWQTEPRPSHYFEAVAVTGTPVTSKEIAANPLHPTSLARVRLLKRQ